MKSSRLILLFILGWLISACNSQPVSLTGLTTDAPSLRTPSPGPSHSSLPPINAAPTPATVSTLDGSIQTPAADQQQTRVYAANAAQEQTDIAGYNLTSTAILREIKATVTPRVFQSVASPDGKWLAQVTQYDCAQIAPAPDAPIAYEVLTVSSWTVETQFLTCGGMGAAGLGGLFWSADSRFFYYTTAREGWPDGGYPWIRPVSRFDTTTGRSETLDVAVFSPDRQQIAGAQSVDLVVWEVESDTVTRFPNPSGDSDWINWVSWSSDGHELVYLVQTNCQDQYPCPSRLMLVNLDAQAQSQLLGKSDPPMLQADWEQPDTIRLLGADFASIWKYDLTNGQLSPAPAATFASEP